MLNGQNDPYFPSEDRTETHVRSCWARPATDKDWKALRGRPLRAAGSELVKETLAWLDRYLGSVR